MADGFFVHEAVAPGFVVLSLCGDLDVATAPALRTRLAELTEVGQFRFILDLAPLGFVDAYGLRVLLAAAAQADARDGWVRLIGVRPRVRRILRILRLTGRLPMYHTIEEAIDAPPRRHISSVTVI